MKRVEVPSYPVSIFMAGPVATARGIAQRFCDAVGLCVTVTPTSYIYTDGNEDGFAVGLINYPRFPATPFAIWDKASELAERLREGLGQQSYTIQSPDRTVWISFREADQ